MRAAAYIAAVLVAAGVGILRADPYVAYAYPSVVQVGTTNRIVVGGQRFWNLKGGWVSGEGVTVVAIERVPNFPVPNGQGQRAWLEKWTYSIWNGDRRRPPLKVADKDLVGWTRCPWWERMDELDPLEFAMSAHYLFTPRNPLQMSPSLAERAVVTVVVGPDAEPGMRDLMLFDPRGISAPRPFGITRERHVAEPLYVPPPRKGRYRKPDPFPPIVPPVVLDGQILPGETDVFPLALKGGERLVCALDGRELTPYLGDAVPGFFNPVLRLTDAAGRELAFADDYGYLPDPVLSCAIPSNGIYRLEVRDNLYRGRDDFVYSVFCRTDGRELPSLSERAFSVSRRPAMRGGATNEAARVCEGRVVEPGAVHTYDFTVEKPGAWNFELFARRLGSPLDGVLTLSGPLTGFLWWRGGPTLATWDDVTNTVFVGSIPQAECDPSGSWTFTEPGDYRIAVADRIGAGGTGYDYRLVLTPARPSFEVYASKSSFVLLPGKKDRLKFKVRAVRRNGFTGPIALKGEPDFHLTPAEIAAGTDTVTVAAEPLRRDWTGMRRVEFIAAAEVVPGRTQRRPVVAADEMEQAFAYTHLLPAEGFRVYNHDQTLGPAAMPAWPDMPVDRLLPPRVIRRHETLPADRTGIVGAMEALVRTEVPLAEAPADAGDGVLAAKFASSAAHLRQRAVPAFAFESGTEGGDAAALAVLAGFERLIDRRLNYADGDARRVRTMARAAATPHDNDVLVYVPAGTGDPLAGPVGALARRLRDQGWCFDFATDATLNAAPFGRLYKALVVPAGVTLPEVLRVKLSEHERKRNFKVLEEDRDLNRRLADRSRRERLPEGVRFARFGVEWGEGWYFAHNPTAAAISGVWRFNIRGRPKTVFVMDVATGKVRCLKNGAAGNGQRFEFALGAGGSAWILATVREVR